MDTLPLTRACLVVACASLLACSLPSKVRYRCELDGGCAIPGQFCMDGWCQPEGTVCVPPEDASVALCPSTAECGFLDAGCGVMVDCGWSCGPGQECGVETPFMCGRRGLCTDSWCWENPFPQGSALRASWSADPFHTWFVGSHGTMVLWNGERTSLVPVPVDAGTTLLGIHGTGVNDFLVVGTAGTLLHWDGQKWESEGVPGGFTDTVRAVYVFPDGRALAAASNGRILRRFPQNPRPSRWTTELFDGGTTSDFVAVWPLGETTFALTASGDVYRLDPSATRWGREYRLPVTPSGGWGSGGQPLWGTEGVLFALGGASVFARDADGGWFQQPDINSYGYPYYSIRGTSLESIWLVGYDVRHFDGGVFRERFFTEEDAGAAFYGPPLSQHPSEYYLTLATIGERMIAAGTGGLLGTCCDREGLPVREISSGTRSPIYGLCGPTTDDHLYAVSESPYGRGRVLERQGSGWVMSESPTAYRMNGCFVQGDTVWAVGSSQKFMRKRVGGGWTTGDFGQSHSGEYYAGWPASPSGPWYFASSRGGEVIVTYDAGITESAFSSLSYADGGNSLRGLSGLSPDEAFGVGRSTLVSLVNGSWEALPEPSPDEMYTLHGAQTIGGGSLYVAAGANGSVWVREGTGSFSAERVSRNPDLRGAWVAPDGTAWVAGTTERGSRNQAWLYVRDGGTWNPESLPFATANAVWGVWDGGVVTLWVAGEGGAILRRR